MGGRNSTDVRDLINTAVGNLSPRNEMFFLNYIFRPRPDLVFSAEYRRLKTYQGFGAPATADQVGLAAGFFF
jgi:hypothetical protein